MRTVERASSWKEAVSSARVKENSLLAPLEKSCQSGKDGKFLLAQGLGQGEQLGKAPGSLHGAKPSGNFVLDFGRLDGPLRTIVIRWHIRVSHEGEDPVVMLDQTLLQPALLWLGQRHLVQGS